MKIEIDMDDVFRDPDGNPEESLQESIRRQIIDKFSGDMRKRLFERLDRELAEIMREQLSEVMSSKMPELIDDIMNATYTPVDRYGSKSAPTTFRDELVRAVAENMKYQPKQYSGDENAFTRAVRSILDAKTAAIKKEILDTVDTQFRKDALAFAVKTLSERLGLPKSA